VETRSTPKLLVVFFLQQPAAQPEGIVFMAGIGHVAALLHPVLECRMHDI
jgi:hypothetical protein